MDNKEFEAVIKLPAQKRYEYFIKKIADYEELWGLYDDRWAMAGYDDNKVIPFWPKEEYAKDCAKGIWENYTPESIGLYEFINEWSKDMENDNIKPAIFYTKENKGIVIEVEKLIDDIEEELENY